MELVFVSKGTTSANNGSITVDYDYNIGKYEVTQLEWYNTMQDNNNNISTMPAIGYGEGDNYPIYNVSWYDCLVFCNRLSTQNGLTPVYSINGTTDDNLWGDSPTNNDEIWNAVVINTLADGYRLPTDIEWQYAARGGKDGVGYVYSGSGNVDEVAWHNGNSGGSSHPVGQKKANELGIYDMSGNVWEWNETKSDYFRYFRGGSWDNDDYSCKIVIQGNSLANYSFNSLGLRVCRSSPQPTYKPIKLNIGMYSDPLSKSYYKGLFSKLFTEGYQNIKANTLYMNPNILPKIYEYGVEINGTEYSSGLQIPLLPQEEKIIYIENYIMPESSTFNTNGDIADIEKYYGIYDTILYNKEMYDIANPSINYFPFLLLTDKVYNNKLGAIEYRDFNNENIQFSFLPTTKENYKSKIIIKNTNTDFSPTTKITPLSVVTSVLEIDMETYNIINIGNVLKLHSQHAIESDAFNITYELYKDYKYSVIAKTHDSTYGKFYITLDKIYPYALSNGTYMSASLYNENIIHLNYLSIRGNPMVYKNGTYTFEDTVSIDRYGEKQYSLKTGLFSLKYLNKLANTMVEERKSVSYDSVNKLYSYDSSNTKFIAEFTIDDYIISIGDIITITEDVYYNIINQPFMIMNISRSNTYNGDRKIKVKAISKTLNKKIDYKSFEEVTTSAIKSISILDPIDYLTDKNLATTTYTDDFGNVYSNTGKTSYITNIEGSKIAISIENIGGIDLSSTILNINNKFYEVVPYSSEAYSATLIASNVNELNIGDLAYIYTTSSVSSSESFVVSGYTSERTGEKLYLSWTCSNNYDRFVIKLYEEDTYAKATAPTNLVATFNTYNEKILIGNGETYSYSIVTGKYYSIIVSVLSISGVEYVQDNIAIYSSKSSKII